MLKYKSNINIKKICKLFAYSFTFFLPAVSLAVNNPPKTINDVFYGFIEGQMSGLVPLFMGIALVTFLAGIARFVGAGDNEEKRAQGRSVMIYGIIVLFVMISVWGFVRIFTQSFLGEDPKMPNYLPHTL